MKYLPKITVTLSILMLTMLLALISGAQAEPESLTFSNKTLEQEQAEKEQRELEQQNSLRGVKQSFYSITVFTDHVGDPTKEGLATFIEQQFGVMFTPNNPEIQNVIFGEYPFYFIRISGNSFLATFSESPRPFSQDEIAWLSNDLLVQNLLQTHKAYVHLQLIGTTTPVTETTAYDLLNSLGSGLCLQGQTRCVVSFPLKKFFVFDEINIKSMLEPNSIALFNTGKNRQGGDQKSPSQGRSPKPITSEELRKIAADRFSIFKRMVSDKQQGWTYQVLVDYEAESGEHEAIWVDVMTITGSKIEGKVSELPLVARELKQDQIIYVNASTVLDWLATDGTTVIQGAEIGN